MTPVVHFLTFAVPIGHRQDIPAFISPQKPHCGPRA
jgi:hypothetical protein